MLIFSWLPDLCPWNCSGSVTLVITFSLEAYLLRISGFCSTILKEEILLKHCMKIKSAGSTDDVEKPCVVYQP